MTALPRELVCFFFGGGIVVYFVERESGLKETWLKILILNKKIAECDYQAQVKAVKRHKIMLKSGHTKLFWWFCAF
jgi:hypothetical protein